MLFKFIIDSDIRLFRLKIKVLFKYRKPNRNDKQNRKYFQQLVKKEYQIDESKNKDLKFLIKNDPLDIYYFYVYVRTVQDAASSLKKFG